LCNQIKAPNVLDGSNHGYSKQHLKAFQDYKIISSHFQFSVFVGRIFKEVMMQTHGTLIAAACSGDIDQVRRILAAYPTQVNEQDSYIGTTPLHCAAHRGFLEIVQVLLEAGADIMARETCCDAIPLHWAAEGGHLEVARLLINRGSEVNAIDSWHNLGPVGWAEVIEHAHNRSPARHDVAEFLLSQGAQLDIFSAIITNNRDAVKRMVIAEPDVLNHQLGVVDKHQKPLHFAVNSDLPEMVQFLLELGADINAKTAWGLTPLCLAVMGQQDKIVELLRSQHAEVDLSAALALGQFDRAEELLKSDPSLVGPTGTYHLLVHFAVQQNSAQAMSILLNHGADANVFTEHYLDMREMVCSLSPLHVAALRGQVDVARVLIDFGANLQLKDDRYESTPFTWAKWNHQNEVAALLK
jgi:ankyrin repeat protein